MKYYRFPRTELNVSQLCFGCWGLVSDAHWGTRVEEDSWQALRAAIDAGINFFDTAPLYGDGASESLIGRFIAKSQLRSQTIIATKIRPNQMKADQVMAACEESLGRLQTDYIDLYQTHWTNREVPLDETWEAMQRLQEQGKVRHIGVCNMGLEDLNTVIRQQNPITNQLPYNLLWRMIESVILPRCREEGIGVLVYSPLMHGILADNYKSASEVPDGRARSRHFSCQRAPTRHGEPGCEAETFAAVDQIRAIASRLGRSMADVALSWTIQQPGVVSLIAGARNASQLKENIDFLENPISSQSIRELNAATDELKVLLGSNPDMWDGIANSRYR